MSLLYRYMKETPRNCTVSMINGQVFTNCSLTKIDGDEVILETQVDNRPQQIFVNKQHIVSVVPTKNGYHRVM